METKLYTSKFCGPCGDAKDELEKHRDLAKLVQIIDTDTKKGDAAAQADGIESVPTFIRPDGKRLEGYPGPAKLRRFLEGK